jgi:hypothetical protein
MKSLKLILVDFYNFPLLFVYIHINGFYLSFINKVSGIRIDGAYLVFTNYFKR